MLLSLPDKVVDISHKGHESMTELAYQAAWARTYLRSYGVIENASRSVWAITSKYAKVDTVDGKVIVAEVVKLNAGKAETAILQMYLRPIRLKVTTPRKTMV